MFIIYNQDGSIKKTNFAEFIQRGNDGTNKIFVCIDGENIQNYTTYALFKLPDGEIGGPINGVQATRTIEGTSYTGYNIPITKDVTMFEGIVHMTLYVENPTTQAVLYTYPVVLTINDTQVTPPDLTQINLEQYQQLLNLITQNGYGFLELTGTSGTLTDDQLELVKGNQTIIKNNSLFYIKVQEQSIIPYEITYSCVYGRDETSSLYLDVYKIRIFAQDKTWARQGAGLGLYKKAKVDELLTAKQDNLTWDNSPTENSLNPVTSGGIYSAIQAAITGAATFKGTVADLTALNAIEDPSAGDMYWVTSESCYYIYNGSIWSAAGGNVDLSNYTTLDTNQIISGVKTIRQTAYDQSYYARLNFADSSTYIYSFNNNFSFFVDSVSKVQISSTKTYFNTHLLPGGAHNPQDLGENSTYGKWRDLYLSGSLSDGTYTVSVANIVDKGSNQTITGTKTFSATTYFGSSSSANNRSELSSTGLRVYEFHPNTGGLLQNSYDITYGINNIVLKSSFNAGISWTTYTLTFPNASGKLLIDGANITPKTTETYDIGSSSYKWRDLYLSRDLKIVGASTTLKLTTSGYDGIIGVDNISTLSFNSSAFWTNVANFDLGRSGNKWRNLYLSGKANIDNGAKIEATTGIPLHVSENTVNQAYCAVEIGGTNGTNVLGLSYDSITRYGSTQGEGIKLAFPNSATSYTLTLPTETGTLATKETTVRKVKISDLEWTFDDDNLDITIKFPRYYVPTYLKFTYYNPVLQADVTNILYEQHVVATGYEFDLAVTNSSAFGIGAAKFIQGQDCTLKLHFTSSGHYTGLKEEYQNGNGGLATMMVKDFDGDLYEV